MPNTHRNQQDGYSLATRRINAKIMWLLNLAWEAEISGFPEYAQFLLEDAFQIVEQRLHRLERKLEQEKES